MAQAVDVNFKLDEDVKKNMVAKKVGQERRIPFEVSADPFFSGSNIRYLDKKMEEYKAGQLQFAEHELIEE